jgi:hypothetical protein
VDSNITYIIGSWSIEFLTMTDIETLANILYIGYGHALILVGVALWIVMVGIVPLAVGYRSSFGST